MATAAKTDLGFIGDFEDWELESCQFPSKVGGKPAWLDLKNLPKPSELSCECCKTPLTFLLQLYCPDDSIPSAFHRTLFLFICRTPNCWPQSQHILVLRSQLPRNNAFYPFHPPQDSPEGGDYMTAESHGDVCPVCGGRADKLCGRCKGVSYCSEMHQRADWKMGHKVEYGGRVSGLLLKQMGLDMEEEPEDEEESNEAEEMEKFENMAENGDTGCLRNEVELEDVEKGQPIDKVFDSWNERVRRAPGQVVRYNRGGAPLWCSKAKLESGVPNCGVCGAERTFEVQVMPQLLHELGLGVEVEEGLDWGSVYVLTCSKSCQINGYVKELAVVRQFDDINLSVN